MERLLLLIVVITMATGGVRARNSVYGTIEDNTTWFLHTLSLHPAMRANIEYQIQYPAVAGSHRPIITFYYNDQDSPNLEEKCERDLYGQLRNEDLAIPLKNRKYRKASCSLDDGIYRCTMATSIQDFEPKSYSFSLAFSCGDHGNLRGLSYNVTIHGESNTTTCQNLQTDSALSKKRDHMDRCERYYPHVAIPNQVGHTDLDTALYQLHQGLSLMDQLIDMITHTRCLQQLYQMACLIVLPECVPETNSIVLPCREDCEEVIGGCVKLSILGRLVEDYVFNCGYLPPRNGTLKCYSKYDTCGPPPDIKHGRVLNQGEPYGYTGQVVHYACAEGMHMTGSSNSTCMSSGAWTNPPSCRRLTLISIIYTGAWTDPPSCHKLTLTMIICISAGFFTFLILAVTMVTICVKRIRNRNKGEGDLGNKHSNHGNYSNQDGNEALGDTASYLYGNQLSNGQGHVNGTSNGLDNGVGGFHGNGLDNDHVISDGDLDPLVRNHVQYE